MVSRRLSKACQPQRYGLNGVNFSRSTHVFTAATLQGWRMIQGLVLTPMRARVALDKIVFWCLSSVFKRPHHVRGVVVGFLRRMLRDRPGLAPG